MLHGIHGQDHPVSTGDAGHWWQEHTVTSPADPAPQPSGSAQDLYAALVSETNTAEAWAGLAEAASSTTA